MKIEDVIKDVQDQIRLSLNENEGEDAVSWERQFGILLSRRQAEVIVDALTRPYEVMPHDHKLNGTVVEDEIMGQSITQPEWHMDPMTLPATRGEIDSIVNGLSDLDSRLRLITDSIDNISVRLQTIEKKML